MTVGDIGEHLATFAAELDGLAAQRLPPDGWIPEAGTASHEKRRAHYVGKGRSRSGLIYVAHCGAACFPFYGQDVAGKIAHHERCGSCVAES